jgi:hypothetical protein
MKENTETLLAAPRLILATASSQNRGMFSQAHYFSAAGDLTTAVWVELFTSLLSIIYIDDTSVGNYYT